MAIQSHEWNIPLHPDLIYHIIDTYLTPFTKLPLCAAFPCLRPYCYPQPFEHMNVGIDSAGPLAKKPFFVQIELFNSVLDKRNPIVISTLDDFGYAVSERGHGVMSLAANLTHDITSFELSVGETGKWCQLDKYTKEFITAMLRRSNLCSVALEDCDIPVNLLGMVQNLKLLDVYSSPGPPENVVSSAGKGKICMEKIIFRNPTNMYRLVGPESPFDWSRLRVIEYNQNGDEALKIQKLLELCFASLRRLDITFHVGKDGFEPAGLVDLTALTNLRHVTLSIYLACWDRWILDDDDSAGTYSSLTPFKWVPIILASFNGHNTIETSVLRFGAIRPEDLKHCDWLSVDKIFEREGT